MIGGRSGRPTVAAVLDEATRRLAGDLAAPAAVLVLASLPLRYLQAHTLLRLEEVDGQVTSYGAVFLTLSLLLTVAAVPAWAGRVMFARAALLGRQGLHGSGEGQGRWGLVPAALRMTPASLLVYAYLALTLEVAMLLICWTLVAVPVLLVLSAVAAVSAPLQDRVGPLRPFVVLARAMPTVRHLLLLPLVFLFALGMGLVNLAMALRLGLWLATGTGLVDRAWWERALSFDNPAVPTLVLMATVLLLEPFWLAAWSAASAARHHLATGDDLRRRLRELAVDHETREAA